MNSYPKTKITRVRFSQHFLTDSNVLKKIEESMSGIENKRVIETGPGKGALTKIISKKNPKSLTLVEKDQSLIESLSNGFKKSSVLNADILDYNIKEDVFVSSVPYSITREILLHLCRFNSIKMSYLIIQKEAAEKILYLNPVPVSVYVRTFFSIEKIFDIKKNSFTPPPKVMSSFIVMKRTTDFLEKHEGYWNFLTKTLSGKKKSAEKLKEEFAGRRIGELTEEELLQAYAYKDIHSH